MSGAIRRSRKKHRLISKPYVVPSHRDPPVPLVFYFHCETTGLNVYDDRMIAIGATIDDSGDKFIAEPKTFASLIHISRGVNAAGKYYCPALSCTYLKIILSFTHQWNCR